MVNTKDLRKAALSVFLSCDEDVAHDLSNKLNRAADEIERLRNELMVLERQFEEYSTHSNY